MGRQVNLERRLAGPLRAVRMGKPWESPNSSIITNWSLLTIRSRAQNHKLAIETPRIFIKLINLMMNAVVTSAAWFPQLPHVATKFCRSLRTTPGRLIPNPDRTAPVCNHHSFYTWMTQQMECNWFKQPRLQPETTYLNQGY